MTNEKFKDYNFKAILVERGDNSILYTECDALAPCSTGGILNPETIPHIKLESSVVHPIINWLMRSVMTMP